MVEPIGHLECLTAWMKEIQKRWPDAKCITQGEFGLLWRKEFKDNSQINYRFAQKGTGVGGSDKDKEIRWFMNKDFRLAYLKNLNDDSEKVIDFTRYDLPAKEPQDMTRKWSLLGIINQKQSRPQDKPIPFNELSERDKEFILKKYPELKE